MAWGARSGVDDLLLRLQQPATASSLCVLSFRKLSDSDIQKLAAAIAHNTLLHELFLSGHALGSAGVAAFADALAVNQTLKHLSLGSDALGDAGVAALCQGLAKNSQSTVATWDLEHKSLGVAGAAALGELLATSSSLRDLSLARNPVGDAGVRALVVDGLARNHSSALQTLTLSETGVSGAALDHLAALLATPHCSLQTLQLSFNDLSESESGSGTSDAFVTALGLNTSLRKLFLKETKLTDAQAIAIATALRTNTTLLELDLSDNGLSTAASVAFADALTGNKTLTKLVLGGNKCGDAGAAALGVVLGEANSTLEVLDLADNGLAHVGIQSLLTATHLKGLRVFNNQLGEGLPAILPVLVANTSIASLDLGANALHGDLSVRLLDALHTHATLTTLELGGNSLGEQGHEALERLRAANPKLDVAADKNAQNEDDMET